MYRRGPALGGYFSGVCRGEAWEYNGRDACLPTDRAPGLEHEEIFAPVFDRFMPFRGLLCRFCDRNCEATVTKRRSRDVR